jgi:hypothetical protein
MGIDITGIGSIADLASSVIGKIWPDKTQAEKDQMAQAMVIIQGQIAAQQSQIDTNKVEAASTNLFVSGWRPFVGWVCGSACAWNWVGLPLANFITAILHRPLAMAPADLTQMLPLLLGMLGMGAIRMTEKLNGVAAK